MSETPNLQRVTRDLRRTIRQKQRLRAIREAARQIAKSLRTLHRLKP
jgi:hypothetical protein